MPKLAKNTVSKSQRSCCTSEGSKIPATFRTASLESQFRQFCQDVAAVVDDSPLAVRIRRVLQTEIEFIDNADFHSAGAESLTMDGELLYEGVCGSSKRSSEPKSVPTHLVRMCQNTVLKSEDEVALFRRMNFLRFKANTYRSKLKLATSTDHDLARIHGLLAAADWYRNRLIRANMRLVISIVKKFANVENSFDDLLSDGVIALIRAIDKFDYDKGFRFSTYATQVIRRNAYRTVMQKYTEKKKVSSSLDDLELDIMQPDRSSNVDEYRWQQLRTKMMELVDQLDRRERFIVRARFSLGAHRRVQTLQRLADVLGVSKERVRQLEKRALEKLRSLSNSSSTSSEAASNNG